MLTAGVFRTTVTIRLRLGRLQMTPWQSDHCPQEGTIVPSTMHNNLSEVTSSPNASFTLVNVFLQMESTIAPSSNRPSFSTASPASPLNFTGCMNGCTSSSDVIPLTMHSSTQLLFEKLDVTWGDSAIVLSIALRSRPSCVSPTAGFSMSGTSTLLTF
jgi:hypothetical protein